MEQNTVSYNRFLYEKRRERKLGKLKFSKKLKINLIAYHFIESGYLCPSKKRTEKISKALDRDFSEYTKGIHTYPEQTKQEKPFAFVTKLCSSLIVRISLLVLTLLSLAGCITGFVGSDYTRNHARNYYSENYLAFVDAVREKGDYTYSLLHEFRRPSISYRDQEKTAIIVVSSEDESLRTINAYLNYKDGKKSTLYFLGKETASYQNVLKVQYSDYESGIQYSSSFTRKDGNFVLDGYISSNQNEFIQEGDEGYDRLAEKLTEHISTLDQDWTFLIQHVLNRDYDFYNGVIADQAKGGKQNFKDEIIYLILSCSGVVLTGVCLFGFIYCFLAGKNRREIVLFHNEAEAKNEPLSREFKSRKNDIKVFPFLPETVLEIVGIVLTFFGSLRRLFYLFSFFFSSSLNPNEFQQAPQALFVSFTIGRFLLYFIDFDIFLEDRRNVRNIFLYGITFFCLYILECTLIDYFSRTRGLVQLATSYYVIPNNFGTIACYFRIRFFLFRTPEKADTKKKVLLFRLCSLLPIGWIIASSVIFQNYKAWGWNLNTWQLYFFNSERPQFSILCVSYLVGLFFLRLFFEHRYGKENAKRFFNSNRFYFRKNILVCLIILVLSLSEFRTRNRSSLPTGIGGYWQIIYLVPLLLFYHPHIGKRNKAVDYFTLFLYFLFFGVGYFIVGAVAFFFFLAR